MVSPTNSKDPLELARRQLDFSAVATGAPSVKEVLFKAQTMAPISPARPWQRITATATAAGLLCLLVLAPWLPQRSCLALLKVDFERQFDRPAAQELLSLFVREMPDAALLGADYGASGAAASSQGPLTMRVSSLSLGTAELERAVRRVIDEQAPDAQPCQVHSGQIRHTAWHSPLTRALSLIDGQAGRRGTSTADEQSRQVLANGEVLAEGLRGQLAQSGRRLEDFGFIGFGAGEAAGYDFVLDCWPAGVGISVENYQGLLDSEQSEVQQRALDFFTAANLCDSRLVLTSNPQPWLPLVVEVRDSLGRYDPRLTSRLQAWIEQPSAAERSSIDFDPQELIGAALRQAIPDYECLIEFDSGPSIHAAGGYLPKAIVTVTGVKLHQYPPLVPSKFTDHENVEY